MMFWGLLYVWYPVPAVKMEMKVDATKWRTGWSPYSYIVAGALGERLSLSYNVEAKVDTGIPHKLKTKTMLYKVITGSTLLSAKHRENQDSAIHSTLDYHWSI